MQKIESLHRRRDIPNIRYVNEGKDKAPSKQSDINKQEFTTLDGREQNAEEDYDDLGLSLLATETIDELKKG